MAKTKILFQSSEYIIGKFLKTGEWINYEGTLTVCDNKTKPVTLDIKCVCNNSFLELVMKPNKTFTGDSISEVYGKLSKWLWSYDIKFQN